MGVKGTPYIFDKNLFWNETLKLPRTLTLGFSVKSDLINSLVFWNIKCIRIVQKI